MNEQSPIELDKALVAHIEQTIRTLRKESGPRFTSRRALAMITAASGAVVGLATLVTWSVNTFTMYGWVTRHEFNEAMTIDSTLYETRADYLADKVGRDARNDHQDAEIKQARETSNEILAFVKIVPQLKVLIRIRCMGNPDVQTTIDGLKVQFKQLTGDEYKEPACSDPEIKALR